MVLVQTAKQVVQLSWQLLRFQRLRCEFHAFRIVAVWRKMKKGLPFGAVGPYGHDAVQSAVSLDARLSSLR